MISYHYNMYRIFLGVTLNTCIVLDNCKRCDLIPRTVGTVLKAVVPTALAVDRPLRLHQLHHGSVAAAAVTTTLLTT